MKALSVDAGQLLSKSLAVTFRLKGVRKVTLRIKAATALLKLAAWVLPGKCSVSVEGNASD